jgi:S1-C subfamily serine protease
MVFGVDDENPTEPQPPAEPPVDAPWANWGEPPAYWGPPAAGPPVPAPPRRPRSILAAILAALVLLSAGVGIGWGLTRDRIGGSVSEQTPVTVPQATSPDSGERLSLQQIAAKVDPAVVDVESVFDPAALGSGGGGSSQRTEGAGTGMILTSSGEVLTNNHVISGSTSITVTIQGRSGKFKAHVVGADPTDDVALIQIEGVSGLPTVTLADTSSLKVGQRVVAIGNAFGRGGTPATSEGTVTALDRSITAGGGPGGPESLSGLIQTDAGISPGESGGPLVNSAGQVVGMITASARVGRIQRVSRIGYAIPTNNALDVVTEIRAGRASSTIIIGRAGFLGVEVRDLDQATAARLGLGVTSGGLIVGVIPGTPAARIGITSNSIITQVDGQDVSSSDALGPLIQVHKPGESIRVTWVDRNGSHTATATLIAGPAV